ncbi:hypothetical protein L9F63_009212, partial [Diploptera punctata]
KYNIQSLPSIIIPLSFETPNRRSCVGSLLPENHKYNVCSQRRGTMYGHLNPLQ